MHHGAVEVFAYQETLLILAVFGITVLALTWAGFRRWLQYKDKLSRQIAEQTAERSVQYGARMERVEARLKAIEHIVTDSGARTTAQVEVSSSPDAAPIEKEERSANP